MSETKGVTILAIGAHPDDIEFGAGGILLKERLSGAKVELVVCSKGESGSNGSPERREQESCRAAERMGARLRFVDLGGDGLMERSKANALLLARVIRELKPAVVLAPSLVANQHPDHSVVGYLAQEAARLARYAGLEALKELPGHAIDSLMYYAITPGAHPEGVTPLVVDISAVFDDWVAVMECHRSQMQTRNYVELQTSRARMEGLQIGSDYAQALYPNDRLIIEGLATAPKGARRF